jgi:hypothetical protein
MFKRKLRRVDSWAPFSCGCSVVKVIENEQRKEKSALSDTSKPNCLCGGVCSCGTSCSEDCCKKHND